MPVPLAALPSLACLLLGIHGALPSLIAGALLLGLGHVGGHLVVARRTADDETLRPPSAGRPRPS